MKTAYKCLGVLACATMVCALLAAQGANPPAPTKEAAPPPDAKANAAPTPLLLDPSLKFAAQQPADGDVAPQERKDLMVLRWMAV